MPKMTVFIRQEDLAAWLALENKSQHIADLLKGTLGFSEVPVKHAADVNSLPAASVINLPRSNSTRIFDKIDFKPCPHGADPQFCKKARPGKPCK